MPTLKYDLVGDVSPLADALAKAEAALKDTTTESAKTDAAVKKLGTTSDKTAADVRDLGTASTKTAAAVDKVGDKSVAASKDVDKFGNATEAAKKGAAGMGGVVGDLAGRIENFAGAAKGAAVALGPVGVVLGAVVLGATAFVAGAIAAASAIVSMQRAAEDAVEELKGLKGALAISKEDVRSVESAGSALDAVEIIAKKLNIAFSADLAPTVQRIAVLVAALGLATIDAANYFGGFGKILQDVINFAINPVNTIMGATVKGLIALAEYLGKEVPASAYEFIDSLVAQNQPLKMFDGMLIETEHSLSDYIKTIEDSLPEIKRFKTGTAEATKEIAKQAEVAKVAEKAATGLASASLASISERLEAERMLAEEKRRLDEEETIRRAAMLAQQSAAADAAIQQQTGQIGSLIANMTAAFAGFQQARVESLDAEVARRQEAVDTMLAQLTEGEGTLSAAQEKEIRRRLNAETTAIAALEKRKKRAAIAAFVASKTAGLAQVAVDTARNLVSFAAPPPLGLGPVAGPIAAVALGGLGAAAVLAAPPPAFRVGGEVPSNAPRFGQSDQRMVLAEPGEKIVNPEQQRKQGGGGPIVALLQLGESEFVRLRSAVLSGPEAERAIRRASGMLGMVPAYGG